MRWLGAVALTARSRCLASQGVTPDAKLAACTAVIESGGDAQSLAAALFARGIAQQDKAQWDFGAYLAEGTYETAPSRTAARRSRSSSTTPAAEKILKQFGAAR
jgi:hypothetical protein